MSSAPYVEEGAAAVARGRRACGRSTRRRYLSERRHGRHDERMTRGVKVEAKADTSRGVAEFIAVKFFRICNGQNGG